MTREESITKYIVPAIERTWNDKICKEILEALEQEPCNEMVSRGVFEQVMWERNVAINQLKELGYELGEKPKTGYWIMPVQDDGMSDPIYYQVRCSKCGFNLDTQTWHMELHQYGADKYCPKCGFRMVEPQESEG